MRYLHWLQEQSLDHPAHQIALQEMVEAVRISKERVERLEKVIEELVPTGLSARFVPALQTLRGVDLIVAVTFATEVGDVTRFESARQLMGYLGLVPGELSTGETVGRGAITKAGNGRVRHMLVESALTYRHPPKLGVRKLYPARSLAGSQRDRVESSEQIDGLISLARSTGKRTTVVCTAIARELAGFMWAVVREAQAIKT